MVRIVSTGNMSAEVFDEDGKEIKYLDKNNKVTNFRVEDYINQRENVEK